MSKKIFYGVTGFSDSTTIFSGLVFGLASLL